MGFLRRLFGPSPAEAPDADGTVEIPQHFFLVVGDLRVAAEFFETRGRGDDFFSQGYVMTGPRGGQYGLFDDALLVPWERAGLVLMNVAGVTHHPKALQRVEFMPSREIALVPEPNNPFDPHAVGIWDLGRTIQLGFVPAEIAAQSTFMGCRAYVFREYREVRTNARTGLKIIVGPSLALDVPDD